MVISPTVGRVVWYHPFASDPSPDPGKQPLAAIVTHVWSDTCVNLAVFDTNGGTFGKTSVLLINGDMEQPSRGYAEWMPYQKGQAAKYEALEKSLPANPYPPGQMPLTQVQPDMDPAAAPTQGRIVSA